MALLPFQRKSYSGFLCSEKILDPANLESRSEYDNHWTTGVDPGDVSGLEGELVWSFKLTADVVWVGVCWFVHDTDRPAFSERDLVGLSVDSNW